ncbi:hypothetical protein BFL35_13100 [Clavibacter michiganensis]|nr:hypothetical protein BFL35_13100 [Clavibacter michiganensis]
MQRGHLDADPQPRALDQRRRGPQVQARGRRLHRRPPVRRQQDRRPDQPDPEPGRRRRQDPRGRGRRRQDAGPRPRGREEPGRHRHRLRPPHQRHRRRRLLRHLRQLQGRPAPGRVHQGPAEARRGRGPVHHGALRRQPRRQQRRLLLRRRVGRPPALRRERQADGALGQVAGHERRLAVHRHPRLGIRRRAGRDGQPPAVVLHGRPEGPGRALAQRQPRARHRGVALQRRLRARRRLARHHRPGRRQGQRPGDPPGQAVHDRLEGHAGARRPGPEDDRRDREGRRGHGQRHQVVRQRQEGRPVLPPRPAGGREGRRAEDARRLRLPQGLRRRPRIRLHPTRATDPNGNQEPQE